MDHAPGFQYLTDGTGWAVAKHYGTLRATLLNGCLYVLARGTHVILLAGSSIAHNAW